MKQANNQLEWQNLDNWSDTPLGVYFSKKDSRVWVPKRRPGIGWTLNFGHPAGMWWLIALIVVPPIVVRLLARRRS
jgi:uncharacterized membrane protein